PVRALGHTSARRRRAVFGAAHPVALPAILRGGAPAPSAPHRAAPGLPRHGRHHVVAGAVTPARAAAGELRHAAAVSLRARAPDVARDRKSTRLNSSHVAISYAVFCLKKKSK